MCFYFEINHKYNFLLANFLLVNKFSFYFQVNLQKHNNTHPADSLHYAGVLITHYINMLHTCSLHRVSSLCSPISVWEQRVDPGWKASGCLLMTSHGCRMTCLTLVCEARLPKHSAVTALLILRADTKGFSLLCSSFVEGKSFPSVSDLFKEKRDKCKPVQLVDTKAEERKNSPRVLYMLQRKAQKFTYIV